MIDLEKNDVSSEEAVSEAAESTPEKKEILIRKGDFKVAAKPSYFKLGFMVGLAFTGIVAVINLIPLGEETNSLMSTVFFVSLFMLLVLGILWMVTAKDKVYTYSAEEDAFVVTNNRGEQQCFYYSEIESIDYSTFRINKSRSGYVVTITTALRKVTYRCIFSDNKVFTNPDGTPFYYLSVNSGVEIPYEGMPVVSEEVMARFADMQKEQKKRVLKKKKPTTAEEFFNSMDED